MNTRRCVLSGQRTPLSLLVFISGQDSGSLVAMPTVLSGGVVSAMLKCLPRARGIVDSRPHSTGHPSPFQTCTRLSDWMQFSLATWTDLTYSEDALCKEIKSVQHGLLHHTDLMRDGELGGLFRLFRTCLLHSTESCRVIRASIILPAAPLKMTKQHEPQHPWLCS